MNSDGTGIVTVVGCGGDRDREKRPLMVDIAVRLSTNVILTSDNPRTEDPDQIISQMMAGVSEALRKRVAVQPDRQRAIEMACTMITAGSLVLIAGKGHEKYQEINGMRHPFDDVQIAETAM
jgi:UDP-N-acetylmuramoyl-L-alanyl-D-glutamate--2,6-diaminopimelate ligase